MPLLRIATSPAADDAINAFAKDISMGGCSFALDYTRALPELLTIKVFFPAGSGALDLEGRAAWKRSGDNGLCIGVAFPGLSELEQRLLQSYFEHVTSVLLPTTRQQAIAQFKQGVALYHHGQFAQAKQEFQKVIREHADVIDVARVARRYHDWCNEKKEGRTHG